MRRALGTPRNEVMKVGSHSCCCCSPLPPAHGWAVLTYKGQRAQVTSQLTPSCDHQAQQLSLRPEVEMWEVGMWEVGRWESGTGHRLGSIPHPGGSCHLGWGGEVVSFGSHSS